MKSIITFFLFFGLTLPTFSQEKEVGAIDIKELPSVVIRRIGTDFSIYIPDKNPDKNILKLQEEFVAYDMGKDIKGSEVYLLIMNTDNNSLAATYNEHGKLMRVVENYKNVKLPNTVIYSIYKNYPDWSIVDDKYIYAQKEGDIIKKHYNVKLKKEKKIIRLKIRPNGEIFKA